MTTTVKARFADGVLTPLEAIDLPEGAVVVLTIDVTDPKALKQLLYEEDIERYFRVLRQDQERAQANDCP